MDKGQVMNAIIYVTSKSMLALNNLGSREIVTQNDDDNAVDYVYISNLEEDAVRALFNRYNYEFAVLNEKARKEILKYGNLDNMALLFETLEENNIRINDYVNCSGKLKTLLCYSDKKTLEEIIGYIKHDLEVTGSSLSVNDCFESYFNVPNVFVRKTKFKVKENGVPNGGPYDPRAYVSGAYQNYVNNRKLLESMGIQDINYAMKNVVVSFQLLMLVMLKENRLLIYIRYQLMFIVQNLVVLRQHIQWRQWIPLLNLVILII